MHRVREVTSSLDMPLSSQKGLRSKSLVQKRSLGHKSMKRATEAKKRAKKTKVDLWREWLVPDNAYRRYPGLRGIYWYWLSRDVREKEWKKWDGLCLTCLTTIPHWTDGHCGHVIAAQNCGEYLRFNRINLTIQHAACNSDRITPQASALNALHYDQRHGQGAWDRLYAMTKTVCKAPRQGEYRDLIRSLPSYQKAVDNAPELVVK